MNKHFFPLVIFVASLGFAIQMQAQTTPETTEESALRADAFAPITKAISSGDLAEAKALLLTMQQTGISPDAFVRWETLAARVAVRSGDAKWLEEMQKGAGLSTNADEIVTITAMRLIFANRLAEAQQLLDRIEDPMAMQEIPRRRYEQLQMKLGELNKNPAQETKWAEKLVEFVGDWESQTCQSCHANPRAHGKEITSFDAESWWVGARYVALLKADGSANQIAAQMREKLARNPNDEGAKIRLAYALRAGGDEKGALEQLRSVPWTTAPDRDFKKPLRFGTFP